MCGCKGGCVGPVDGVSGCVTLGPSVYEQEKWEGNYKIMGASFGKSAVRLCGRGCWGAHIDSSEVHNGSIQRRKADWCWMERGKKQAVI